MPAKPSPTGGQDAALVFATQAWVTVAGLICQSMLAYLLLPEGRGAYAVCVAFAHILGIFLTFGADQGAQFFSMTKQMSVSKCLLAALGLSLVGSALGAAAALPLIHSGLAFFQKADPSAFLASLALIPLTACSFAAEMQLAGIKRFAALLRLTLARSAATVLGTLLLVWQFEMGVQGALLALCASHAVMLLGCFQDLRKNLRLGFEPPSWTELAQILHYGLRIHLTRLGNVLEKHIGILALAILADRLALGLFAAVSAIMLHLHLIADSVGIALYPRTVGDAAKAPQLIGRCLRLACLATAGTLALLLAVSAPLVRLLLSEAFLPAVPMMWIMAPGILAFAAANLLTTYFKGIDRPGICSWAAWAGLLVNAAACFALHPALGMESAAWALSLGLCVRTAWLGIAFHRRTDMALGAVWLPNREDFAYCWDALRAAGRNWLS